jgi:hypothetical protein
VFLQLLLLKPMPMPMPPVLMLPPMLPMFLSLPSTLLLLRQPLLLLLQLYFLTAGASNRLPDAPEAQADLNDVSASCFVNRDGVDMFLASAEPDFTTRLLLRQGNILILEMQRATL